MTELNISPDEFASVVAVYAFAAGIASFVGQKLRHGPIRP